MQLLLHEMLYRESLKEHLRETILPNTFPVLSSIQSILHSQKSTLKTKQLDFLYCKHED